MQMKHNPNLEICNLLDKNLVHFERHGFALVSITNDYSEGFRKAVGPGMNPWFYLMVTPHVFSHETFPFIYWTFRVLFSPLAKTRVEITTCDLQEIDTIIQQSKDLFLAGHYPTFWHAVYPQLA